MILIRVLINFCKQDIGEKLIVFSLESYDNIVEVYKKSSLYSLDGLEIERALR